MPRYPFFEQCGYKIMFFHAIGDDPKESKPYKFRLNWHFDDFSRLSAKQEQQLLTELAELCEAYPAVIHQFKCYSSTTQTYTNEVDEREAWQLIIDGLEECVVIASEESFTFTAPVVTRMEKRAARINELTNVEASSGVLGTNIKLKEAFYLLPRRQDFEGPYQEAFIALEEDEQREIDHLKKVLNESKQKHDAYKDSLDNGQVTLYLRGEAKQDELEAFAVAIEAFCRDHELRPSTCLRPADAPLTKYISMRQDRAEMGGRYVDAVEDKSSARQLTSEMMGTSMFTGLQKALSQAAEAKEAGNHSAQACVRS